MEEFWQEYFFFQTAKKIKREICCYGNSYLKNTVTKGNRISNYQAASLTIWFSF